MVQYSQLLKFQRSCWKTWLGCPEGEVGPVGPRLLIGLAQKADVVDLEAGRAPLVGGLELEPLAADLGEAHLHVAAAERGAGRVEGQRPVGALVEVHRILLGLRDRRRAALPPG